MWERQRIKDHFKMFLPLYVRAKIIRKAILSAVDKKTDKEKLMINIGGGLYFRRHWKVMDFHSKWYNYPNGCIDYEYDLTSDKPFPLTDNSISFFFLSHALEHVPQEHCQHVLNEIHRCLKPGGAMRFNLPDFDLAYDAFAKNDIGFFSDYFGHDIGVKFLFFFASYMRERVPMDELKRNFLSMKKESFANYYTMQIPRSFQKGSAWNHINWWNFDKLSRMLKAAGFNDVYRSSEQGSRFTELRSRGKNCGFDSNHPKISFFTEAIKWVGVKRKHLKLKKSMLN